MQTDSLIGCTQKEYLGKNYDHNSKGFLAEDMETTILNLSNELNEAREVLRRKKSVLNAQYSESNKDENNPKREFQQFMEKFSSVGKDECQPIMISNSRSNTDLEEFDKKKSSNPIVNFDVLKRLLVVVNKINKTYDPIRI